MCILFFIRKYHTQCIPIFIFYSMFFSISFWEPMLNSSHIPEQRRPLTHACFFILRRNTKRKTYYLQSLFIRNRKLGRLPRGVQNNESPGSVNKRGGGGIINDYIIGTTRHIILLLLLFLILINDRIVVVDDNRPSSSARRSRDTLKIRGWRCSICMSTILQLQTIHYNRIWVYKNHIDVFCHTTTTRQQTHAYTRCYYCYYNHYIIIIIVIIEYIPAGETRQTDRLTFDNYVIQVHHAIV